MTILINILKSVSSNLHKTMIVYRGNNLSDIENITKIRSDCFIFALSEDEYFIRQVKLYYGVLSKKLQNPEITSKEIK